MPILLLLAVALLCAPLCDAAFGQSVATLPHGAAAPHASPAHAGPTHAAPRNAGSGGLVTPRASQGSPAAAGLSAPAAFRTPAPPDVTPSSRERFVVASDGTRLHVTEAGSSNERTLLFVPGWTMPAWIFTPQIQAFSRQYRVLAFDPRGQGASDVAASGYEPYRRARDIAEVIAALAPERPVVVAWSLGVLDTLAYVHGFGDRGVAGLVLVDNSVGEEPPPTPLPHRPGPVLPHPEKMRRFVTGMFVHSPGPVYLERLTQATLRTPEYASKLLLAYPMPRSYWREAVYAATCPVLYVVRPRWAAQAENLQRNRPGTETALFATAGHALFVDEPARFNAVLDSFVRRRIWP
jgi:microsomal epoxide hydrolase